MTLMFETRFLRPVHVLKVFENCSIQLNNNGNNFFEANNHLQQFRADKLSSFFFIYFIFKSETFTFSSASSIHSAFKFGQKRCNTSKGFRARFQCLLHFMKKLFLFSVFSIATFVSFTFFFRSSITFHRVFHKTIILLGLNKKNSSKKYFFLSLNRKT